MKKLTFVLLLALAFSLPVQATVFDDSQSFELTRVFKLGRSSLSSTTDGPIVSTGGGPSVGKSCDSKCLAGSCNTVTGQCSKCSSSDYYISGGRCEICPAGKVCNGITAKGICDGMTCVTGYTATVSDDRCCCKEDIPDTPNPPVTDPTTDSMECSASGQVTSCPTGMYEHSSGTACCNNSTDTLDMCDMCAQDPVDTVCPAGQYGTYPNCTDCPLNAECDGGTTFTCKSGFRNTGSSCLLSYSSATCDTNGCALSCPDGMTMRSDGRGCCPPGQTSDEYCFMCVSKVVDEFNDDLACALR